MPQVEVRRFGDGGIGAPSVFEDIEVKSLFERVRQRALDLFHQRLSGPGSGINYVQEADAAQQGEGFEFKETQDGLEVEVAVPGFAAKEIQVTATPGMLIVIAKNNFKTEQDTAQSYSCEFGERQMLRQIRLPASISLKSVWAEAEEGVLRVKATKETFKQRALAAAAASGYAGSYEAADAVQPSLSSPFADQLFEIVAQYAPGSIISPNTTLDELGISSLERLVLTMELEQRLGILISDSELGGFETLGDLARITRNSVGEEIPYWGSLLSGENA